jgi:hypothetical protein
VRQLLPIVSCLLFVPPAFGQTVDENGAAQVARDLARYVGQIAIDRHIVTVGVEGGSYRIAVDFKALKDLVSPMDPGAKLDLAPLSLLAKPLPNGTWDVASGTFPQGSLEFDGPEGRQSMQWTITGGEFVGIYDPALAGFRNSTGSLQGMTLVTKEAKQEVHATFGAGTFAMAGVASPGGGTDFALSEVLGDFVETVQVTDDGSGMNFPVTLKARNLAVSIGAQGYRTRAILDLLAFVVANADEAKIRANQAEFKSRLAAVLPVWNRIEGEYGFNGLSVSTPVGSFGADRFGIAFGIDGAVPNGSITYETSAAGMSLPGEVLPAWTVPLLPTDMDISVSGVGFHVDAMAKKLLDNLDLNKEPPIPDAVGDAIAMEFIANPPKIVISRSTVKNSDTEVAAEGEVVFIGTEPEANVTVEVAGYDKMIEKVQIAAKNEPEITQYMAFALAAKGFAKTLPDGRLQWNLLRKADGSVSVNGVMLKGPDPR